MEENDSTPVYATDLLFDNIIGDNHGNCSNEPSNDNHSNSSKPNVTTDGIKENFNISSSKITSTVNNLRPVEEIPIPYRSLFQSYPFFNVIHSKIFNDIFYTDVPIVISAPTGSGKTAILELAIVKLLMTLEVARYKRDYKIVYIAPLKALCEERLVDWHRKFSTLGLSCICVTGDSVDFDYSGLMNNNLIITTPEKWDSLTRKWKENKKLVSVVKLFMIDEIHLLNEEQRGATLEAIVSRMKTIQESLCDQTVDLDVPDKIRFVGISATIPNVADIAEWLGTPSNPAKYFRFEDDMRPVKLQKIVLGYHYNSAMSSPFKFDIMLNYRLHNILLQHSAGKPTLIFCSTRKSVEVTSKHLSQNLTIGLNSEQKKILAEAASNIADVKVREIIKHGVGSYHAGMLYENRKLVEKLFRSGDLPILVTTSSLAMGVNLPAHLVIIKSTKYYADGEYKDYNESTLFQMVGRAGRPQFDTSATAVIMTTAADKVKYENMVGGEQAIESHLHRHLAEHLNAEVVLRTITDLSVAMQWLTSTFLYVRAKKNPRHYGLAQGLTQVQLDKKLLEMCQIEINKLARAGMLKIDQNISIVPTANGSLMARYYIALETMKLFTQVSGHEALQQILGLVSKCREFSEMFLRKNDKKTLNLLNKCKSRETIRFTLGGKIQTLDMKINCIIQAVLGCLEILESSLLVEAHKIMRIGERLSSCLAEYLETKPNCYSALLNTVILAKCFRARIWEDSPFVSRQLVGIGVHLSNLLVAADKTTFKAILNSNPRDIERIINRKIGDKIQDQIRQLPKYALTVKADQCHGDTATVRIIVQLENATNFENEITVEPDSCMNLLIGDSENNVILHEKYTHSYMINNPEIIKIIDVASQTEREIYAHFISEDWVGIDAQAAIVLFSSPGKETIDESEKIQEPKVASEKIKKGTTQPQVKTKNAKTGKSKGTSHIQQFMDTYFKKVKSSDKQSMGNNANFGKAIKSKEKRCEKLKSTKEPFQYPHNETMEKTNEKLKIACQQYEESKTDATNHGIKVNESQLLENDSNLEDVTHDISNNLTARLQNILNETHKGYTMALGKQKPQEEKCQNLKAIIKKRNTDRQMMRGMKFEESLYAGNSQKHKNDESHVHLKQFMLTPRKKYTYTSITEEPGCGKEEDDHGQSVYAITEIIEPEKENDQLKGGKDEDSGNCVRKTKSCDNQKTITWRSPLVLSSNVKYSPHLSQPQYTASDSAQCSRNKDTSFDSVLNASTISKSTVQTDSTSNSKTSVRPTLKNKISSFPLTDKQWLNNSDNLVAKDQNDSIISNSFFEKIGLMNGRHGETNTRKIEEKIDNESVALPHTGLSKSQLQDEISPKNNERSSRFESHLNNSGDFRTFKRVKTKSTNSASYYAELMRKLGKVVEINEELPFVNCNEKVDNGSNKLKLEFTEAVDIKPEFNNNCLSLTAQNTSGHPELNTNDKNLGATQSSNGNAFSAKNPECRSHFNSTCINTDTHMHGNNNFAEHYGSIVKDYGVGNSAKRRKYSTDKLMLERSQSWEKEFLESEPIFNDSSDTSKTSHNLPEQYNPPMSNATNCRSNIMVREPTQALSGYNQDRNNVTGELRQQSYYKNPGQTYTNISDRFENENWNSETMHLFNQNVHSHNNQRQQPHINLIYSNSNNASLFIPDCYKRPDNYYCSGLNYTSTNMDMEHHLDEYKPLERPELAKDRYNVKRREFLNNRKNLDDDNHINEHWPNKKILRNCESPTENEKFLLEASFQMKQDHNGSRVWPNNDEINRTAVSHPGNTAHEYYKPESQHNKKLLNDDTTQNWPVQKTLNSTHCNATSHTRDYLLETSFQKNRTSIQEGREPGRTWSNEDHLNNRVISHSSNAQGEYYNLESQLKTNEKTCNWADKVKTNGPQYLQMLAKTGSTYYMVPEVKSIRREEFDTRSKPVPNKINNTYNAVSNSLMEGKINCPSNDFMGSNTSHRNIYSRESSSNELKANNNRRHNNGHDNTNRNWPNPANLPMIRQSNNYNPVIQFPRIQNDYDSGRSSEHWNNHRYDETPNGIPTNYINSEICENQRQQFLIDNRISRTNHDLYNERYEKFDIIPNIQYLDYDPYKNSNYKDVSTHAMPKCKPKVFYEQNYERNELLEVPINQYNIRNIDQEIHAPIPSTDFINRPFGLKQFRVQREDDKMNCKQVAYNEDVANKSNNKLKRQSSIDLKSQDFQTPGNIMATKNMKMQERYTDTNEVRKPYESKNSYKKSPEDYRYTDVPKKQLPCNTTMLIPSMDLDSRSENYAYYLPHVPFHYPHPTNNEIFPPTVSPFVNLNPNFQSTINLGPTNRPQNQLYCDDDEMRPYNTGDKQFLIRRYFQSCDLKDKGQYSTSESNSRKSGANMNYTITSQEIQDMDSYSNIRN